MKKLISLLLVMILIVSCAACGSKPAEKTPDAPTASEAPAKTETPAKQEEAKVDPVTITWEINETANLTREQYMVVKDAFEAAHPDIKVELKLHTTDSQDYVTQIAAGTLSDISHNMADLANLEGVWAEVPQWLQDKWDDAYLFTANGVVNAVPVCGQGHYCVIYDKAAFAAKGLEEPKTWDEFLAICDTFVADGTAPLMGWGAGNSTFFVEAWAVVNLSNYLKATYDNFNAELKAGTAKWNDAGIVDVIKEFQSWNANGYYHEGSASLDYANAQVEFLNGGAPMMIDGVWALVGLDAEKYGMFFLPEVTGSNYMSQYMCYWGVSEASENKDAAWTFVDWVLTGDGLKYYTEQILAYDAQVSFIDGAPSYEMDALVKEYYDGYNGERQAYNSDLFIAGDNALPAGFEPYLCSELSKIFFENQDVDIIMEGVQAEYQRYLAEQG